MVEFYMVHVDHFKVRDLEDEVLGELFHKIHEEATSTSGAAEASLILLEDGLIEAGQRFHLELLDLVLQLLAFGVGSVEELREDQLDAREFDFDGLPSDKNWYILLDALPRDRELQLTDVALHDLQIDIVLQQQVLLKFEVLEHQRTVPKTYVDLLTVHFPKVGGQELSFTQLQYLGQDE
jgi:hypothetical protein